MIDWASVRDLIRDHANAAYPTEGCGFIFVNPLRVSSVVNIAEWPYAQFRIRGEDTLAAFRTGECVGMWHSHPEDPVVPSGMDEELAIPGLYFLVYAVADEDLAVFLKADDGRLKMESLV